MGNPRHGKPSNTTLISTSSTPKRDFLSLHGGENVVEKVKDLELGKAVHGSNVLCIGPSERAAGV